MMDPSLDMSTVEFLEKIGVGSRPINDPFFDESYRVCQVFQRLGVTVEDDENLCHQVMSEFTCNAPGCQATFDNLLNFEIHYNTTHRYTCSECKKIKPNARLLEIHIQETHDSFFKTLAEKQPMYQCYVSDCNEKFADGDVRKEHCISVHKFPKHFRFDNVSKKNIKKIEESSNSMEIDKPTKNIQITSKNSSISLGKNQKVKTFSTQMKNTDKESKIDKNPLPVQVQTFEPKSSPLVFIPRQLTHKPFSKVLTQGQSMNREVLDTNSIMDLGEALPT